MQIITITLNPAIDQTVTVEHLVPGTVHRATSVRQNAGGKGINVASCLADYGLTPEVHGLLGEENTASFDTLFAEKGITDRLLRIPGATRVNLKIVDSEGTTDINLTGPHIAGERIEEIAAGAEAIAGADTLAVLSGSLPPGCPADAWSAMTRRLKAAGARVLLDTSGAPLTTALNGDVLPDIIKPNRDELADWSGEALPEMSDIVRVATRLNERGIMLVVVSMGSEGALFLSVEGAFIARLKAEHITSTVGAGDAMVAGLAAALAGRAGPEQMARMATAFAVGKLGLPGPALPDQDTLRRLAADVTITELSNS
ncbi:1-phosphofructokinase [Acetobacter sp. AN02]|uniref:1-phosphofructokinase n=1 Tax=Acetobacter sp. AN02 TaxID=2894186 RepID=UPI002434317F|nr:1-phosphofructokinase [Acetobacter sp. AN02]MDG6095436.1 1-phosphofructokinase [Acetobacter sp. AN02]